MIELVAWVLTVLGITYLVSMSVITSLVRVLAWKVSTFLGSGFYCAACTGFWVGIAVGFSWTPLFATHPSRFGRILLSGIAAMALGHLLSIITPGGNPMWSAEREARNDLRPDAAGPEPDDGA